MRVIICLETGIRIVQVESKPLISTDFLENPIRIRVFSDRYSSAYVMFGRGGDGVLILRIQQSTQSIKNPKKSSMTGAMAKIGLGK